MLGSGAFGMVVRGKAMGIQDRNGEETVAVKMLKGVIPVVFIFKYRFNRMLRLCFVTS